MTRVGIEPYTLALKGLRLNHLSNEPYTILLRLFNNPVPFEQLYYTMPIIESQHFFQRNL